MHPHEVWWVSLIKAVVIVNLVMGAFAYTTWLERKLLGRMQRRFGPNRAGPFGLLQPIADLVKLVRKEAFFPATAHDVPYIIAPVLSCATAILAFSVIPFGRGWTIHGYYVAGELVNVPISLILIFALGSIGIYGFIVGGWASDSKYSTLGSMRTCAQLVSYEVSLALSVLGVVLMGQSLNLVDIIAKQQETLWFFIPQFVGFCIFFLCAIAETSRPPFDLPEADTELVAGYHTEYSGMRWGLFQTAEYINMIVLSGLAVALFFDGWHFPFVQLPRQPRPDLVRREARHLRLRLHLAARFAAAPALRPADALRLEDPAPSGHDQRARHGLPGGAGEMRALASNMLKQVFQRWRNRVTPTRPHLFVVPAQRARPLSPGEARRRREAAVINYWLGTRS
jgi:NADH-quinone oxidoreductase subunit H